MLKFIRQHSALIGVLGTVITIIGLFFSYYFYSESQITKEPVVIETNHFPIFASPDKLEDRNFAFVSKPDFEEIKDNVYVQEVAFWNNGNTSIKYDDVLVPIQLSYPNSVEIIDYYISASSVPKVVKAKVIKDDSSNELSLRFNILEEDSGFKILIIYANSDKAALNIKGHIEGVKSFTYKEGLANNNLVYGLMDIGLAFLAVLIVIVILALCVTGYVALTKKLGKNSLFSKVISTIIILLCIVLVGVALYLHIQKSAVNKVDTLVPPMTILTEGEK